MKLGENYQEKMLSIQKLMTPDFASKEEIRETFYYEGGFHKITTIN